MQDRPTFSELARCLAEWIDEPLRRAIPESADQTLAHASSLCRRLAEAPTGSDAAVSAISVHTALAMVTDEADSEARFLFRVAEHVASILEREAAAGPHAVTAEGERLATLLGDGSCEAPRFTYATVRALQAQVSRKLRDGSLDDRLDAVIDVLRLGLVERLAVARPGWTDVVDDGRG